MPQQLNQQPWWTPADQAELNLLTLELVHGMTWHFDNCPNGYTTSHGSRHCDCPSIGQAIDTVLEWRESRVLHSKAAYLRHLQNQQDAA